MNVVALSVLILFLTGVSAGRAEEKPPVQTVTVVDGPDLSVHLLVKSRPSMADPDWLAFEFANHGKAPIAIDTAYYSIDCVAKSRQEKNWRLATALALGNSRDLFPKTWKSGPGPAIVLQPNETYRMSEQLSDFGAATLGLPPRGGLDVTCTLEMFICSSERQVFKTPRDKFTFAFEWACPDETGLQVIQDRLKQMLHNPVNEPHYYLLLGTLLRTENIVKVVSREDLFTSLKLCGERSVCRFHIADTLNKKYDATNELIVFYGDRLRVKELTSLDEVNRLGLWSPSFISAVADCYSPTSPVNSIVLDLLHQHRDDWLEHKDDVRKLTGLIKKLHPVLDKSPENLAGEDLAKWAWAVGEIAMVADQSFIPVLRPALEDKRVWWRPDPRSAVTVFGARPPLIRVCDTACEAITVILEGKKASRCLLDLSFGNGLHAPTESAFVADRDAMLEQLQKTLDVRDTEGK